MNAEAETATRPCLLQDAVGRVEACPGAGCCFWEDGGAVLAGGCAVERLSLELVRRPELAHHLLEVRRELGRTHRGEDDGRSLFYRLGR